jgi:GTP cyclohydrolase I
MAWARPSRAASSITAEKRSRGNSAAGGAARGPPAAAGGDEAMRFAGAKPPERQGGRRMNDGEDRQVDTDRPVSDRIRNRLRRAGKRFNANDNIGAFVEPGEIDLLLEEVAGKMRGVLESLVIDIENDHNTQDTARRVAKMYLNEVFQGRYRAAPSVTEFPNVTSLSELMIVGPITVRSACSHHFCPIMGRLWIGVMPNQHSNLIGLSKYARLAEWVMSRPQIQEEAISQLAELLIDMVKPDGLAVVMEADHFCMQWRGVKDTGSKMTNSVMRGSFLKDPALRREFLSLISLKE